eukprot:7166257-Pyramimonas_sp.AAC.1
MATAQLSDVVHGDLVSFSGYKVDTLGANAVNTILRDAYPSADAKPMYAELAIRTAQLASHLKKAGRPGLPTLSTSNDFSTRPEHRLPLKDVSYFRNLQKHARLHTLSSFVCPSRWASSCDAVRTMFLILMTF